MIFGCQDLGKNIHYLQIATAFMHAYYMLAHDCSITLINIDVSHMVYNIMMEEITITVHKVHLRAMRWRLDDPERRQTTAYVPRPDVPVALLEQAGFSFQSKQDIKVRQGRNIPSQKITYGQTMY